METLMTQLLAVRNKITEIYHKAGMPINYIAKFLFCFLSFYGCHRLVDYNGKFSGMIIMVAFSFICTFLPFSMGIIMMVLYVVLQLYSVSLLMAATVLFIAAIMYCFFIRYITKYGAVIAGVPLAMGIRMHYAFPVTFGLVSTPVSIIPVCVGIFAYYFLKGINRNAGTLEQVKEADSPFDLYIQVIDSVLKNQSMIVTMIVFALVIIVVYIIRNMKMDYAFEIAAATGVLTCIIGYIILGFKFDLDVSILSVVIFSVISGAVSYAILFIYRPLSYATVENVQFEDDDYYYYVRAVPKIKPASKKITYKHVISPAKKDGVDDDVYNEDGLMNDYAKSPSPRFKTAGGDSNTASLSKEEALKIKKTSDAEMERSTMMGQNVRRTVRTQENSNIGRSMESRNSESINRRQAEAQRTGGAGTQARPQSGTQRTGGAGTQARPQAGTQRTGGAGTQARPQSGTQRTGMAGTQARPQTGTQRSNDTN